LKLINLKKAIKANQFSYELALRLLRLKRVVIYNLIDGPRSLGQYIKELYNPALNQNSLEHQKKWCERARNEYIDKDHYCVGTSISNESSIGEYSKLSNEVFIPLSKDKVCLEIGCLDGKWSSEIVNNSKISYLCDLDKCVKEVLAKRLLENKIDPSKWQFHEINGLDLNNFKDKSIDFIFSMDSLTRVPKEALLNYISEAVRLMRDENSVAILHIPIVEDKECHKRRFTNINLKELISYLSNLDTIYSIKKSVYRGVLLILKPNKINFNSSKALTQLSITAQSKMPW
tara:strand:+ start:204 stop:1067 length:864 start_codon:yes stop_codon:yes gene_type:complete